MLINIKQKQEMILEIMKEVIKVCENNNITYYCQAGTVLGAIRHNGFIPWDDDADIIIPNDQIDKFVICCSKELPEKFHCDFYKFDDSSYRLFPRVGYKGTKTKSIHLDVFRLIGLPDDHDEQLAMIKEAKEYTLANKQIRAPWYKLLLRGKFKYLFEKIKDNKMYDKKFDELCHRYPYKEATYVMNPNGRYGARNIFDKKVYGAGQMHQFENIEVRIPSEIDFYLRQYYDDYLKLPDQEHIDKAMNKMTEI